MSREATGSGQRAMASRTSDTVRISDNNCGSLACGAYIAYTGTPLRPNARSASVMAGSRRVAVAGIAWGSHHRSVWYSRYSSRARGSIEEMYICS